MKYLVPVNISRMQSIHLRLRKQHRQGAEWSYKNWRIVAQGETMTGGRILIHCCCEYKWGQEIWKSVWRFLQMLNRFTTRSGDTTVEGLTIGSTSFYRVTCSFMFIAVLFLITKNWKHCRSPSTEE